MSIQVPVASVIESFRKIRGNLNNEWAASEWYLFEQTQKRKVTRRIAKLGREEKARRVGRFYSIHPVEWLGARQLDSFL